MKWVIGKIKIFYNNLLKNKFMFILKLIKFYMTCPFSCLKSHCTVKTKKYYLFLKPIEGIFYDKKVYRMNSVTGRLYEPCRITETITVIIKNDQLCW